MKKDKMLIGDNIKKVKEKMPMVFYLTVFIFAVSCITAIILFCCYVLLLNAGFMTEITLMWLVLVLFIGSAIISTSLVRGLGNRIIFGSLRKITSASKAVANGEFELDSLYEMNTPDAKRELLKLNGVGNKVADCITLFALNRFDSFPVDVWIKRIMEYCYFGNKPQQIPIITQFANDRFGDLGGIAQQYLFYYARSLKIGT